MNKDKYKEIENLKKLLITGTLYLIFFFMSKFEIINFNVGVISIIIFYLMFIFFSIKMYFSSKRSQILLFLFSIFNMIYFMIGEFSLKIIICFFIFILGLIYLLIKIEGKSEKSNIIEYIFLYVIFEIIFIFMITIL